MGISAEFLSNGKHARNTIPSAELDVPDPAVSQKWTGRKVEQGVQLWHYGNQKWTGLHWFEWRFVEQKNTDRLFRL